MSAPGSAGAGVQAGWVRAMVFEEFGRPPEVRDVPDPAPPPDGAVIRVAATGLCRSDWHGWRGHDPDIVPPHVPGHEFAGDVVAVGAEVRRWRGGERVTAPFVCACGNCAACFAGQQQVCERQTQPGFTHWGSFAEHVVVRHADLNLVPLPDELDYDAAASLGCRFATAFRAVVAQGAARPGEWVAVFGCGGVGLSALLIAAAAGARTIAVDVSPAALELARGLGAVAVSAGDGDPAGAVRELTGGGAHVAIDALGSPATCAAAIASLRIRGRHVQVGLLPEPTAVPMNLVIARELTVLGSHGMPAHDYPELLRLITAGVLRPGDLVTGALTLDEAPAALMAMDGPTPPGIRLIRP